MSESELQGLSAAAHLWSVTLNTVILVSSNKSQIN